jgi:hypothetical protein
MLIKKSPAGKNRQKRTTKLSENSYKKTQALHGVTPA